MAEGNNGPEVKFGDPGSIAFSRASKKEKARILSRPEGYSRYKQNIPELSDEDFKTLFGELSPEPTGKIEEISLLSEDKPIPQYTLPNGTIRLNGWYGDSETEEIGRVEAEDGIVVDILGVRRPQKDKGPAPSWKVQETRVGKDGKLIKQIYYVGRRGKQFIGENPNK